MRQDDQIVLTTYGRSSGFCVDPIEKKPVNHFLPGSAVLSFGTAGCNLGCRYYLQQALNFQVHDVGTAPASAARAGGHRMEGAPDE